MVSLALIAVDHIQLMSVDPTGKHQQDQLAAEGATSPPEYIDLAVTLPYSARISATHAIAPVALAYAQCTAGASSPRLERWVEKTPTNERFIDRLRSEFPEARLIHVVRHPYAVYASRKETG